MFTIPELIAINLFVFIVLTIGTIKYAIKRKFDILECAMSNNYVQVANRQDSDNFHWEKFVKEG